MNIIKEDVKRCTNCGKYPLCNRENNNGCDKWIKRDIEMKLNKVERKVNLLRENK